MTVPHVHTDGDGEKMTIGNDGSPGVAVISLDGVVFVHPHELAGIVAALYEACGQPVPHLPRIDNPDDVKKLATLIHYAMDGTVGTGGTRVEQYARVLLAHGVRLPEATS